MTAGVINRTGLTEEVMARPKGSKNSYQWWHGHHPNKGKQKPLRARQCTQCGCDFLGKNGSKICSLRCMLEAHSMPSGDCIVWTGYRRGGGYGEVDFGGRRMLSNRAAWLAFNGEDPGPHCVCHACDNPACVNPKHLWLGSRQQNTADRQAKQRQARGERNGPAKLTEADVRAIRADGRGCRVLAREYGVHMSTIMSIRRGDTWKHVVGG